jgi:hypothetical protein
MGFIFEPVILVISSVTGVRHAAEALPTPQTPNVSGIKSADFTKRFANISRVWEP